MLKNLSANAGDTGDVGLIPGLRGSSEGENGNPLQYCCLGNPMDRGAWRVVALRAAKCQTRLSMHERTHAAMFM